MATLTSGAAAIGSLIATLGLDSAPLINGAKQAESALTKLDRSVMGVIGTVGKIGAAAAAAGAGLIAGLVKSGLEAIDAQAKFVKNVDGTIGGLRALEMAAGDAGVSQNELRNSVEKMTMRLGEAIRGEGRMRDMLAALNLSAEELIQLDVDERMALIADRINEYGLSAAQAGDLLRQFGIRNIEMAELMRQGGDAIREQSREVDRLGLRLSAVDATQIEMANDAMGIFEDVLVSIRDKVTVAIAPFLAEFSERFRALAIDAGGFGDHAVRAMEFVFTGIAKVADVVQGLRVVWKGLELVVVGFGAAVTSVLQVAVEAVVQFNDTIGSAVNFAINALNKLPNVDIATIEPFTNSEFMQGFRRMADEMRNRVGETRSELHELAMQEMPSSKVEEFFAAVRDRARETAEDVVAAREASIGEGAEGFASGPTLDEQEAEAERAAEEEARYREQLDNKLQALTEFVASEEELEAMRHEKRLEDLEELFENEHILEAEYLALREELEQEHADNVVKIRESGMTELEKVTQQSYAKQAQFASKYLSDITAAAATQSKAVFEINKLAAIANTALHAKEAIVGAYKVGAGIGGPVLGAAFATAAGLATAAEIAGIHSQEFGGGGARTAPSASVTPAPAVTPVDQSGNATGGGPIDRRVFALEGVDPERMYSGRQLRKLWENLMEVVEDGNRAGIKTDVVFT